MYKASIIVPLHIINDAEHTKKFLGTFQRLNQSFEGDFLWYIDANGCDVETSNCLKNGLNGKNDVKLHVEENGSRRLAMNRGLDFTRAFSLPYCIFLNDDVEPLETTFEALIKVLSSGIPVAGSLSTPYPIPLDGIPSVKNSVSLVGELAFYNKGISSGARTFRGDCYGMDTTFISEFPNVHSDDIYLRILFHHRFGKEIPIADEAQVFRVHESRARDAVRRIQRYFEGRKQLRDYFIATDPNLALLFDRLVSTPELSTIEPLFFEARDRVRRLTQGKRRESILETPELNREYESFSDLAMLYLTLKRLKRGENVLTSGETMWKR